MLPAVRQAMSIEGFDTLTEQALGYLEGLKVRGPGVSRDSGGRSTYWMHFSSGLLVEISMLFYWD